MTGPVFRRSARAAIVVVAVAGSVVSPAAAATLESALAHAYQNNPQLNSQRAVVRATDEGVPQALSGYRPKISATVDVGEQYTDTATKSSSGGVTVYSGSSATLTPRGVGVTGTQTLLNGHQTANRTRQAESQVFAARETLRVMEQTVLLDGVTTYMNVLRDTAILELQRRNVEVLQEQLRQTNDRFRVGEVTKTDVAQSQSRLAAARSSMLVAQSNLTASRANYRRVIGVDPERLAPGMPVDRLAPGTLDMAVALGQSSNPQVTAAMYGVDVSALQVKISEGALYPVVTLETAASKRYEVSTSVTESFSASVVGRMTVPIYQGGSEYATIRQSKESLGQKRLDLDTVRDQVRATVVQSWGQLEATRAQIQAAQAQVTAAEIALNGVREEARVGQRTTLDVLNAQQELVNARVALVTAQRDRVVASFSLLSATGRLSARTLKLPVAGYDPNVHYNQVRDSWFGVRTPDGK